MSDVNDFQNVYTAKVIPNEYLNSFIKSETYDTRYDFKNTKYGRQNIKYVDFIEDKSSPTTEWKEVIIKEEWIDIIETERYKCAFCSKAFKSANVLQNHERRHKQNLNAERDYYWCSNCNQKFCTTWALNIHVCKKYRKYFEAEEESIDKPYKCAPCQRSFSTPWALQIHVCKNRAIVTPNRRTMRTVERQSFKCNLCNKRFLFSYAFATHRCTIDEEITYRCPFCNKYFVKSLYKLHKQLHIEQANTVKSLLQTLQ